MKYCYYDKLGNIIAIGNVDPSVKLHAPTDLGVEIYRGEVTEEDLIDPETKTRLVGAKGPRPSLHHEWDHDALVWVPNIAKLRAEKVAQVMKERARRRGESVTVDGTAVDGHDLAFDAVHAKVNAMSNRPSGMGNVPNKHLIWRDKHGARRAFTNHQQLRAFLNTLLATIDDRNTDVEHWAWDKLDQINAATTWEALDAIDPAL